MDFKFIYFEFYKGALACLADVRKEVPPFSPQPPSFFFKDSKLEKINPNIQDIIPAKVRAHPPKILNTWLMSRCKEAASSASRTLLFRFEGL